MPTNPLNVAEIPLEIFGGLDTELGPTDLPAGLSPANQDVVYLPGSVGSRPCLRRAFTAAIAGKPKIAYLKTYRKPDATPVNLYLDSAGELRTENVSTAPGVLADALAVTPGSIAKSCTAFGREWMAFSNGLLGLDVPRQFNGDNFDRVTQDGPGAPPTSVADYTSSAAITSIAANGSSISTISAVSAPDGQSASVTVTTSTDHGLSPGDIVQVVGSPGPRYNGQWQVLTVPSATKFTYQVFFSAIAITAINRISNVEEVASAVPHNLQTGDTVTVQGVPDSSLNGSFAVTSIQSATQWKCTNAGDDTTPSAGDGTFAPTALANASGGSVFSSATATFATLPDNANVGDPLQISGSAAGNGSHPYDSNAGGNPATWPILSISGSDITFSISGIAGLTDTNSSTTGGTATVGGLSSTGQYQCVQFFLTRNGAFTAPSPPIYFSSVGGAKFQVTGAAIGPPNVVARFFGFTGAGGATFFTIPVSRTLANQQPGGDPIVIEATTINDNSTTSAVFNFSDTALFESLGIDIPGNNLFNQVVLGPCLGFFAYGRRLFAWGEFNKVQNLLNMGFDGGYISANVPTGWTVGTSGGELTTSGVDYGFGWKITGDGGASARGQITQPAYQDYLGVPVILPATQYTVRAWIEASGETGSVVVDLYSATGGVLATATIALSGVSATGKFYEANWDAETPAVMPADAVLRIYALDQANGQTATIDEVSIGPTENPLNLSARASYIDNPEAFDGKTGVIGPNADPTQVKCLSLIRETLLLTTGAGRYATTASAVGEPATWQVNTISKEVGALSIFSVDAGATGTGDSGEEWDLVAARAGLYIYAGGELPKISQEIQPTWERINWDAAQTIWVKSDALTRRIYVGVPLDDATAPSHILVLDRRELETAGDIARGAPLRVSYTGRMISTDLTRKWSIWNLAMNCAEIMALPLGDSGLMVGCGSAFGQAYTFDAALLTDQDYGQVSPQYTTYFFVEHEQEQQYGLGLQRKLVKQINVFASGVGKLIITPLADSLTNEWPSPFPITLSLSPTFDQPMGLNVSGERVAFRIESQPLADQTDNGFSIGKIVVMMATAPVAQTRGSVI